MKNLIAYSQRIKSGVFDDDYTLYDNGEILHEYDIHAYPGGYNLKDTLTVNELSDDVKERLLKGALAGREEIVKEILGMTD